MHGNIIDKKYTEEINYLSTDKLGNTKNRRKSVIKDNIFQKMQERKNNFTVNIVKAEFIKD